MDSQGVLRELIDGHERFLNGTSIHPHSSAQRLEQLVPGQHPIAAVLGCADSRVPVELLFDAGFGDLFVVRNAGSACTPAAIATLEYGVQQLGIRVLLVLGHEACGAVTAACRPEGLLTPNLEDLVLSIRHGLREVDATADLSQAFRINAVQSARHVVLGSALLQRGLEQGDLLLETACYTLKRGEIEWLGQVDSAGSLKPSSVETLGL